MREMPDSQRYLNLINNVEDAVVFPARKFVFGKKCTIVTFCRKTTNEDNQFIKKNKHGFLIQI